MKRTPEQEAARKVRQANSRATPRCSACHNDVSRLQQEAGSTLCSRCQSAKDEQALNGWTETTQGQMPPIETPVLVVYRGERRILERRTYKPYYDDSVHVHDYWDDPHDEGRDIDDHEVTYWQALPELPGE